MLEIVLAGKTGTLGLEFSINEADVQRAKGVTATGTFGGQM